MKKLYKLLSLFAVMLLAFTSISTAQRSLQQPVKYFAQADELTLDDVNQMHSASFSVTDTVVIVKFLADPEFLYYFTSSHSGSTQNLEVKVQLFHESDTTYATGNLLKANPDGRANSGDFRLTGWHPLKSSATDEYLDGYYYIRMYPGAGQIGNFNFRYFRTNIQEHAFKAEPNNTVAEALGNFENTVLPTDGIPRRFMLWSPDTTRTNPGNRIYNNTGDLLRVGEDDRDLFIIEGIQGQRLEVETMPHLGFQFTNTLLPDLGHSRDTDTAIRVWDADFTNELASNDDISGNDPARVRYPQASNIYSRVVIESLPYTGLYFLEVVGWASTSWSPGRYPDGLTDSDPGRGDYLVFAQMTQNGTAELEPNDSPEQASPIYASQNDVFSGSFSSASDVDYYQVYMNEHTMYYINSANSTVTTDIKVEIYDVDDLNTNLAEGIQLGRYGSNDFRLSGFVPPRASAYVIKLSSDSPGDYDLRVAFTVIPNFISTFEPNNTVAEALQLDPLPVDSTIVNAMFWPQGDVDYYYFDGVAGDQITVSTLPFFEGWLRDVDTFMKVMDTNGNTLAQNDDGDGVGVYSTIRFEVPADGVYIVEVTPYFSAVNGRTPTLANNEVGAYKLYVKSELAGGPQLETEPNNHFASATLLQPGDLINASFDSASDIDIFRVELKAGNIYNFRSIDAALGGNMTVEWYSAVDTTTNLHDGSNWHNRYGSGNFKIAGIFPQVDGDYFIRINPPSSLGEGNYKVMMRETDLGGVLDREEPNNTIEEAQANAAYPMDGIPRTFVLFNPEDPKFDNDVDIFRLELKAGQIMEAETLPVGGVNWARDTDTYIDLLSSTGEVLASNDDGGIEWYSKLSRVAPADETVFLRVYTSYHALRNNTVNDRDIARGDYVLQASSFLRELEPNNTAAEANDMIVSDNGVMHASFSADDLTDWFKVTLKGGYIYFMNTAESNVSQNIRVEVYAENDLAQNLIDESPFGRYSSNDFLLAFTPPADGVYLVKLSLPATGLVGAESTYKFRVAGGVYTPEMLEELDEPNDTMVEADAIGNLLADSNSYEAEVGHHVASDVDYFMIEGIADMMLTAETFPANGERWVRDYDTILRVFDQDGNVLGSNDDKSDPLTSELYDISNIYSRVILESLPYTGKYYVQVVPYNGGFEERTPTFGRPAVGPYNLKIDMTEIVSTSIDENLTTLPVEYALNQNYPNPFNPTTTIRYQLPQAGHVTLVVYNILGQQVASLVDGQIIAGIHSVAFDANRLASGVYLYRLQAGNYVEVRKMLLIK